MEDAHLWVMDADGTNRLELGNAIDNRQGSPQWSADGRHLYFTVQERGNVRLMRLPVAGGAPEVVVGDRGSVGAWAIGGKTLAYAFASPSAPADLYTTSGDAPAERRTDLNQALLAQRTVAGVDAFTFPSTDGTTMQADFLENAPVENHAASRTWDERHDERMFIRCH